MFNFYMYIIVQTLKNSNFYKSLKVCTIVTLVTIVQTLKNSNLIKMVWLMYKTRPNYILFILLCTKIYYLLIIYLKIYFLTTSHHQSHHKLICYYFYELFFFRYMENISLQRSLYTFHLHMLALL